MKKLTEHELKFTGDLKGIDFSQIRKLMAEIKQLGYDGKTAAHFARLIGNKPIVDTDGLTLVMDGDNVLAKLKLNHVSELNR